MNVAERLAQIRARITAAAARVGRDADAVTLVAVSKRQPLSKIIEAYDAGQRDFGENLAQELERHATAMAETGRRARWHFIGGLQRNKVNTVLPHASFVHSIDRPELAIALDKRLGDDGLDVLLQVNIGRESQKGGVLPEAARELADVVRRLPHLRLRGLMCIPPVDADPRPHFSALASLFAELRPADAPEAWSILSMGMSDDFEVAVELGATLVRVGTAIFGERDTGE